MLTECPNSTPFGPSLQRPSGAGIFLCSFPLLPLARSRLLLLHVNVSRLQVCHRYRLHFMDRDLTTIAIRLRRPTVPRPRRLLTFSPWAWVGFGFLPLSMLGTAPLNLMQAWGAPLPTIFSWASMSLDVLLILSRFPPQIIATVQQLVIRGSERKKGRGPKGGGETARARTHARTHARSERRGNNKGINLTVPIRPQRRSCDIVNGGSLLCKYNILPVPLMTSPVDEDANCSCLVEGQGVSAEGVETLLKFLIPHNVAVAVT